MNVQWQVNPKADVFRSVRSQINGKPIRDVVRPLAAAFLCVS